MRDALSLLDQALAFGGGAVKEQEVRDMLGSVSRDKVIRLITAILSRDAAQTMNIVAELAEMSPDFENVLAEMLSLLHHMSLAKTVPEALDEFVSAREQLLKLSEEVSAEDLHLFYQIALIGRRDLPLSPDARNGFEMILLRMLAFRPVTAAAAPVSGNTAGSTSVTTQAATQAASAASASVSAAPAGDSAAARAAARAAVETSTPQAAQAPPQVTPQASVQSAPVAPAVAEPEPASLAYSQEPSHEGVQVNTQGSTDRGAQEVAHGTSNDWREVVNGLGLGGLVKQLAINCTMKQRDGCNIVLQIESGHSNLLNPKAKQRLQQALGEYFNIDAQLEIEVATNVEAESPAQTIKREVDERQQQAERAVEEDSFTQSLKESFNAELVPGSVKPVS
jgi:DNA polymerase-3 subunit gamma/tau